MSDQESNVSPESDERTRWERELMQKVIMSTIAENRRSRRWGIFFKSLTFLYLFALLVLLYPDWLSEKVVLNKSHTALIELAGVIAPDSKASADNVVSGLRDAFEDKNTKGIILRINSPGGSPVQAGYINDEIRRLKKKYPKIPVYAVLSDICASGGYYVAVAADEIYADKGSLVGSIGVLMNGFGFVETLEKLGMERRLLTAGERKGIMDPFSPLSDADESHIQSMLDKLHAQFIGVVKQGRGDRLKENGDTFSGLFWSGEESLELGLVDGLGNSSYVARELIGEENIVDFTHKEDVWERFAERVGSGAASTLARITGFAQLPQLAP